jgi:hypothetical protein
MQTRDNRKQVEEKRDLELENIAGNLFIAEYQVDKLQTRLSDMINGYRPQIKSNKASTHVFKHNNKWYKLSLRVNEVNITSAKDVAEQEFDY